MVNIVTMVIAVITIITCVKIIYCGFIITMICIYDDLMIERWYGIMVTKLVNIHDNDVSSIMLPFDREISV